MPLLETTKSHWLLLVADLHECCFLVYGSLSRVVDKNKQALVDSAMSRNCYLWLESNFCVSFEPTMVGGVNCVTHIVINVSMA